MGGTQSDPSVAACADESGGRGAHEEEALVSVVTIFIDVAVIWVGFSQIRALLPVQITQVEEELMRKVNKFPKEVIRLL